MPYRAAALPNVTAFNVRAFALGDYRRKLLGGVALGLGAVAAIAVVGGAATMAAAWMLSSSLSANAHLRPAGVVALEAAELPRPHRTLTETASLVGVPHSLYEAPEIAVAELAPAAALAPVRRFPISRPPAQLCARLRQSGSPNEQWGTPCRRRVRRLLRMREIARASMPAPALQAPRAVPMQVPAAPAPAPAPAPSPAPATLFTSITDFLKRLTPRFAYNNPDVHPTPDSHTAVYDIESHTVYMPNGERLEAHSGLGSQIDDPRYVSERGEGQSAAEPLRSDAARRTFPRRAGDPPQSGQRRQDVWPRGHPCTHLHAWPQRSVLWMHVVSEIIEVPASLLARRGHAPRRRPTL